MAANWPARPKLGGTHATGGVTKTNLMAELVTHEQFRKLENHLGDINRKLDSVDRWRAQIQNQQEKHGETLYGNGKPGMDEMLRQLFAWMNEQKAKENDKAGEIRKYLFWAATFIAGQALTNWLMP